MLLFDLCRDDKKLWEIANIKDGNHESIDRSREYMTP